jgi:hypothetical protein
MEVSTKAIYRAITELEPGIEFSADDLASMVSRIRSDVLAGRELTSAALQVVSEYRAYYQKDSR